MTPDDYPVMSPKPMGEWSHYGSCRYHDVAIWFSEDPTAEAYAKSICSACPVKHQCKSYALDANELYGTWGELSESERRRIRRKRWKMNHGTRSRYSSGCRCDPCREANTAYARQRSA